MASGAQHSPQGGHVNDLIRAAGVVLLRDGARGREVLVLHRPHRQDWSLPKGKLDRGEHTIAAAVRETIEEAAIVPTLGIGIGQTRYDSLGRPKAVDYWVASPAQELDFTPNDEIDDRRWIPVEEAESVLTYPRDVETVRRALAQPVSVPLILLRHAQAVKRADFDGDCDKDRPISSEGKRQAKDMVALLSAFGIRRVYSSDALRCQETVRRFARHRELKVRLVPELSEEGHRDSAKSAAHRMRELIGVRKPLVVCSHRPVLPTLMGTILKAPGAKTYERTLDPKLPPGGFVIVHRVIDPAGDVSVVGVERHEV